MPEQQASLLRAATDLQPAMVDAIRTLVTIESPTADIHSCNRIIGLAAALCTEWLGTPARVEEHQGRSALCWGPAHPSVLLLGHLDTVWPIGTLGRLPWAVADDRMTGPGVFDMKAGVVQAWAALRILRANSIDISGVGLLLTTDEETGSHCSRELIIDAITEASAVLVLEPSADGALKTARKGTSWYLITFHGRAAHAGLNPEQGINATVEAACLILATLGWGDADAGTTVTPTVIASGTTANTVPATAELTLDVRAWSATEQQRIDALVRGWQAQHPEASITIAGGIDRPAMEASSSERLFGLAKEVSLEIGIPEVQSCAVGGASDGNLTAAAGVATLDGLGAVGDGAHADHEWASVSALPQRAALIAGIIQRLIGQLPEFSKNNTDKGIHG